MEFVHHPGSVKPNFQTLQGGNLLYQGAASGPTIVDPSGEGAGQPGWSVIAWRGGGGNYRIEYTKAIEWRPEAVSGVLQQAPVTFAPEYTYTEAVRQLDANPGWWHRAMQSAASAGGRMLGTAARSAMQAAMFAGGGTRNIRPSRYQITYGDL